MPLPLKRSVLEQKKRLRGTGKTNRGFSTGNRPRRSPPGSGRKSVFFSRPGSHRLAYFLLARKQRSVSDPPLLWWHAYAKGPPHSWRTETEPDAPKREPTRVLPSLGRARPRAAKKTRPFSRGHDCSWLFGASLATNRSGQANHCFNSSTNLCRIGNLHGKTSAWTR